MFSIIFSPLCGKCFFSDYQFWQFAVHLNKGHVNVCHNIVSPLKYHILIFYCENIGVNDIFYFNIMYDIEFHINQILPTIQVQLFGYVTLFTWDMAGIFTQPPRYLTWIMMVSTK